MEESKHQLETASRSVSVPHAGRLRRPTESKGCWLTSPSKSRTTFSLFQSVLPKATQGRGLWESKVQLSQANTTRNHHSLREVFLNSQHTVKHFLFVRFLSFPSGDHWCKPRTGSIQSVTHSLPSMPMAPFSPVGGGLPSIF